MKKIIYTLILSYLAVGLSYAQQPIMDMGNTGYITTIRFNNVKANRYDVLRGSPYLSENFEKAIFQLNSGQWAEGMFARFNTYNQQIEYKKDSEIMTSTLQNIKSFKIGETLFKSGFERMEKQSSAPFYQVLYDGKIALLKYTATELKEVKNFDNTKEGNEFVTYQYYYFLDADKKMTKITLSKKVIMKVFPESKETDIEAFIKEKNIKFKTWDEVIELVKYVDTI